MIAFDICGKIVFFCFYDDPISPYMLYFKNQKSKEAGEIGGTIYSQEIVRVNRMITGVGSQEKVRFDIETAERVYSLKAPNAKECRAWVDLLTASVERQGFTLERGFSASEIRQSSRSPTNDSRVGTGDLRVGNTDFRTGLQPSHTYHPNITSVSPGKLARPVSPLNLSKRKKDKTQDLSTYSRELWKKSLPEELEGWLRKQARISRHLWNKRYFQFINERTGEDEDHIVMRPKLQYFKNEKHKHQGHPPKGWLYCDKIQSVHI